MHPIGVIAYALLPIALAGCALDAYRKGFKRRAGLLLLAVLLTTLSIMGRFMDSRVLDGFLAFMTGVSVVAALQYAIARIRGTAA